MNHRLLGLICIFCSPFLLIDFLINGMSQTNPVTVGLFDMIYMTGWMCGVLGLYQINAAGKTKIGKGVLLIQIIFLIVAQLSTFLSIFTVRTATVWSNISDVMWPLCNLFMIVAGIVIIRAKVLTGWKRFVPVTMGLWLPVTGVVMNLFEPDLILFTFSGPYSAIAWGLLGFAVYKTTIAGQTSSVQKVRLQDIGLAT